jgi:uncharacterized protein YjiS (DUF1127 family)
MSNAVLSGFADDDEDKVQYRRVFGKMFASLAFNINLVQSGFCKLYIADMNQKDYEQYTRLLWMLEQMSDKPLSDSSED